MAKLPPIRYGTYEAINLVKFAIQLNPHLKSQAWAEILAAMNVTRNVTEEGVHYIWIPD
jgi:hypothetical protein